MMRALLAAACLGAAAAEFWSAAPGFQMCTITDDGCIQSQQFGDGYYFTNDQCSFIVHEEDWECRTIVVDTFDTRQADILVINGERYKGRSGPQGVRPTGTIVWSTGPLQSQRAGWRLCPSDRTCPASDSSGSDASTDSSGSSGGGRVVVYVIVGILGGLVCTALALGCCLCRTMNADHAPAPARTAPSGTKPMVVGGPIGVPPPGVAVVRPAAMSYPVDSETPGVAMGPMASSASGTASASTSNFVPKKARKLTVPDQEKQPPGYWRNKALTTPFNKTEPANDEIQAFQRIMDNTFKNVTTRDRRGGALPKRLKVIKVMRNENSALWLQYTAGRHGVQSKREHRCTPTAAYGGEVVTTSQLPEAMKRSLKPRINEAFFFHGTTPEGAQGICANGFKLDRAGANAGMMYGGGAYFAECSSKSDEYAAEQADGIFQGMYCLILCRVVLGEMLHMTTGGENTFTMIKSAMESEAYDSVMGDRQASVGTYREFVAYQEDQIYPEYIIIYEREM